MTFNYYRELEKEAQLKKLEPIRREAFNALSKMRKVRVDDRTVKLVPIEKEEENLI